MLKKVDIAEDQKVQKNVKVDSDSTAESNLESTESTEVDKKLGVQGAENGGLKEEVLGENEGKEEENKGNFEEEMGENLMESVAENSGLEEGLEGENGGKIGGKKENLGENNGEVDFEKGAEKEQSEGSKVEAVEIKNNKWKYKVSREILEKPYEKRGFKFGPGEVVSPQFFEKSEEVIEGLGIKEKELYGDLVAIVKVLKFP